MTRISTTMRKRKTRMSGNRRAALVAILGVGAILAAAGAKKRDTGTYGIVAGTVFRDPGFALPDAKVELMQHDGSKTRKLQQAVSSPHGEFSFRVPAELATYVVRASAKGYQPAEKEATISGEIRVEVSLTLIPESK
jgi:carboxypeptidase family protein